LAAFRVRFSDFQEHPGKTMRAIGVEEEQKTEPYTAILLYMEKLMIIESADRWKEIRELRNAINHEYGENTARLSEFFAAQVQAFPSCSPGMTASLNFVGFIIGNRKTDLSPSAY